MGFIELTPGGTFLETVPVVLLRLLRLVRVFRLAQALPRLRAIIEALISGFGAVKWVMLLIFTFNYVSGCAMMLVLQQADPFHWASISRALLSILRLETLDNWDAILRIAMLGCTNADPGYAYIKDLECRNGPKLGWVAAIIFFILVVLGAFVLPTVLIGVSCDDKSCLILRSFFHITQPLIQILPYSFE